MKAIDRKLIEGAVAAAKISPRKRQTVNLHESYSDVFQRMINAIEPDSYIRPHKHEDKTELFLILKGAIAVILFDDKGKITEKKVLEENGNTMAVEIPPKTWHTAVSLKTGTVIFEAKQGPYDPTTVKLFPKWAPEEQTSAGGKYLDGLKKLLSGM